MRVVRSERAGAQAGPRWLSRIIPRLGSSFSRNLALGSLVELFLVTAVASLLLIRGFLALTGFPQVGGGTLHIAHMLWGGLLMLASQLLLLGFIGRRTLYVAAFLSGAGFGTFIDELGKFITRDNNYFFQPAIAIVYVIFILVFLVMRGLETRGRLSDRELLANAFDVVREAVVHRRRAGQAVRVVAYLEDHAGADPLLASFRDRLERTPVGPMPLPGPLRRLRRVLLHAYIRLIDSGRLNRVVIGMLLLFAGFMLLTLVAAAAAYPRGPRSPLEKSGIAFSGLLTSNVLSALLILAAAWRLRSSHLGALFWFHRAVLVDLLLGQVFAFYLLQFAALVGVTVDACVLVVLNGAIHTQRHLARMRQEAHAIAAVSEPVRAGSATPRSP